MSGKGTSGTVNSSGTNSQVENQKPNYYKPTMPRSLDAVAPAKPPIVYIRFGTSIWKPSTYDPKWQRLPSKAQLKWVEAANAENGINSREIIEKAFRLF